ncbi:MAG: response regulator [Phycisphaerales bacterium]|nr:response regulator [Phycisphaerales bacterium]
MGAPQVIDTLRMPAKELEAVLRELDRHAHKGKAVQRKTKRWRVQPQKMVVSVVNELGPTSHVLAVPRNLSHTGIGFLFGGFLHPGTRVFVTLRRMDGQAANMPGTVVHCRLIKGRLHEVGMRFDREVNPREFFIEVRDGYAFRCEAVDPSHLKGLVLAVEDNELDRRLLQQNFNETDVELMFAPDGAKGLELLRNQPALVFLDQGLPDMDGLDWIGKARERGHEGPIVMMTATIDHELRLAAIGAGASELVFKPLPPHVILQAAAEYLLPSASGESSAA